MSVEIQDLNPKNKNFIDFLDPPKNRSHVL